MQNIARIPVLLLTGYLGSGKTTLVNHILTNKRGIRFAVIVNDLGEVNIDASLIQRGGIVGQRDESLVALQNGCICCTLRMDLVEQISELTRQGCFDYIVIEASGICEPEPIARTICSIPRMGEEYIAHGMAGLDCIVTVVDAWRMQSEFDCGRRLTAKVAEEDIENLLIQQIEFCNIVLLNKVSAVKPDEVQRLRLIIAQLNPQARIIETDYAQVDLDQILYTGLFSYGATASAAGWIKQIDRETTDAEDAEAKRRHDHDYEEHLNHDEHHHDHDDHHHDHDEEHSHHHHHHDHDEGEAEEYGIGTFVYYRRQAFDLDRFDRFVNLHWPKEVIRAKGVCYFSNDRDMSYLFEQAGAQIKLSEAGQWYATMPADELADMLRREPALAHDWDDDYGDRMQKLVFIGQQMDRDEITRRLDECLTQ